MASRMGYQAVKALAEGKTNRVICARAYQMVDIDITEGLSMKKGLNEQQYEVLHFDIVGQAADVPGSVAMIAQTKPQVVLLDVHVPGGEVAAVPRFSPNRGPTPPLPCFWHCRFRDAPQDVGSVIRAGAQGYVTKTITGADLISSIKQVHEGYAVFSPKLAGFVLDLPGCAGGGV